MSNCNKTSVSHHNNADSSIPCVVTTSSANFTAFIYLPPPNPLLSTQCNNIIPNPCPAASTFIWAVPWKRFSWRTAYQWDMLTGAAPLPCFSLAGWSCIHYPAQGQTPTIPQDLCYCILEPLFEPEMCNSIEVRICTKSLSKTKAATSLICSGI